MNATNTHAPDHDQAQDILAPYADILTDAVERADDPANADVLACLAALARGEPVPDAAAERVVERARSDR